ncbi:MAG TPA: inorganic phosphate transporter [Blastocatellia bacterium]|jgi:PiT family inorganic phosphate transporter|nr:inorganic phosphate transporter [Blastocatellia bacterium]
MTTALVFIALIIAVALLFDVANGWHDAANSIATVVSTRVLSPGVAVIWAAFFNFVAFALFGTRVAQTIGGDLVDIERIAEQWRLWVLLCGLIGAIIWDVITWYFGLPTSSSHALVGGYAGATIAAYGGIVGALKPEGWIKTISFIFISPLLGMILGVAFTVAIAWIFRRRSPSRVDRLFRRGQLFSAALYSLGHGGADAQKTMGIIAAVLAAGGVNLGATEHIPLWVVLSCHAAMALGTMVGGWRIVRTMGSRITKLKPVGGFAAETAGALTLFMAIYGGIPVSTTHTITGAIVGVGATRRLSAVRWGVARRVVWAWVMTIPCSALMAAICFFIVAALHK